MNEEQRTFLDGRVKAAIEQQPEIELLRKRLLEIGGVEMVPPPTLDDEVPILLECGLVINGSVIQRPMERSGCHENVAQLWLDKTNGLSGIGTGYALSEDGLWRQHSWAVGQDEIIETTKGRFKYFGILLEGAAADSFAENQ